MRRISALMAATIVLLILFMDYFGLDFDMNKLEAAEIIARNGELEVDGVVREVSQTDEEHFRMIADTESAGRIMIRIKSQSDINIYDLPGRQFQVKLLPERQKGASNPGEFNYDRYLRTKGIYLISECNETEVKFKDIDSNFYRGFIKNSVSNVKNRFYEKMESLTDEETAGLFSGMLFGDKDRMPEEDYESFRKNGTAHVLCVSGLHVGIIYGAVNLIAGKRKRSPEVLAVTIILLGMFALLASFSLSVMRAICMIALHMTAERIHCRYDMLSAAFITASIFLIMNPLTLFSAGFIFSFTAVISMAVIGGGIRRYVKHENVLMKIMIPIISIQIGMIPINIHMFNTFSASAFISNIPVIFLSSIIIPLGMLAFTVFSTGGIMEPIADMLCNWCGILGKMLCYYNDLTGAYGRLCFDVPSPSTCITMMFYLAVFLVFSEYSYLNLLKWKAIIIFMMAAILLVPVMNLEFHAKPDVVFLDVGQGDCIHIRTEENKNYLIDGGGSLFSEYDVGERVIYPYLMKNGVDHLDGIFISHMDADHYKGISSLNRMMDNERIYLYEGYEESETIVADRLNVSEDKIEYIGFGDRIILGKDVFLDVIYPEKNEKLAMSVDDTEGAEDLNEYSLVMKLNYKGKRILFTGDIGKCEDEITADSLCDIIKVPHHGSKYSSSEQFIEKVNPQIAVIQVGKNNFGHPAKSVIERYMKKGIIIFRNDLDGAVMIYVDGSECRMKGFRSGAEHEL